MNTLPTNYDLLDALEDGSLRDVSDIARRIGLPYPTFITAAFWNSVEISRLDYRVQLALEGVSANISKPPKPETFGSFQLCISPDLHSKGWPSAACPWMIPLRMTVERSRQFAAVVFVSDPEETIDFRTGGTFYLM